MATARLRFITADDLMKFRFPADPQISPDGRRVLYTVRIVEGEKYCQHLWVDGEPFTLGRVTDALPRWSPDGGRIAFVRTRDEETQIWLMSITGGEPRPVTSLPPGKISALEWSPEGGRLAFVFRRDPAPELKKGEEAAPPAPHHPPPLQGGGDRIPRPRARPHPRGVDRRAPRGAAHRGRLG